MMDSTDRKSQTSGGSIHRLRSVIHLPADWSGLFALAGGLTSAVIYIIIETNMKAQLTNPVQNATSSHERFRAGLILGGIVVAIIVSIFLSQEVNGQTIVPSIMPHTSVVAKQVVLQSTNISVEAVIDVIERLF